MLLTFSKLGFSFQSILAYCLGFKIICFRLDAVILPLRSCIQSEGEDVAPLPARHVARRVLAGRVASDVGAGAGAALEAGAIEGL